jgi:hypothetical protein
MKKRNIIFLFMSKKERFWPAAPKEAKPNPYDGTFMESLGRPSAARTMAMETRKTAGKPDAGPRPGL